MNNSVRGTVRAQSSHSLIGPGIGCAETDTSNGRLDERIFSMDGNRPPGNGGDETRYASKKNFAACKFEPIRENHPCGHIYRPCGNRRPEVHEVTLEKPDLDRSGDRTENDPGDRSFD